jgi:hypothetical protein
MSTYIKQSEKYQINNIIMQLKFLEKWKQAKLKIINKK